MRAYDYIFSETVDGFAEALTDLDGRHYFEVVGLMGPGLQYTLEKDNPAKYGYVAIVKRCPRD